MPKRTEAQKRAQERYNAKKDVKARYAAAKKEHFKTIAACYKKQEAEYIAAVFAARGIKPAEVIRGAAAALLDGEPVRLAREPLTLPPSDGAQQPAPVDMTDGDGDDEQTPND